MNDATRFDRTTALKVVFACTIGNMVCLTAAVSAPFGVFLVPIATELNVPRAQISGVLGVIALVHTLPGLSSRAKASYAVSYGHAL